MSEHGLRNVKCKNHFNASASFCRGTVGSVLWTSEHQYSACESQEEESEFEQGALSGKTLGLRSKQGRIPPLLFAQVVSPRAISVEQDECRDEQQQIKVFGMGKLEHKLYGMRRSQVSRRRISKSSSPNAAQANGV